MKTDEKKVMDYFEDIDLDIRKSKFSRFMDQKITPDVLCFIADCILNLPNSKKFKTKDIWESQYFIENTVAIFGKPIPTNEKAKNEYDKFIIQPLRMLNYSKILNSSKERNAYTYSIKNEELLEFIAIKERNALLFLYHYILKILKDSNIWIYFNFFIDKGINKSLTKEDYLDLRNRFIRFMRGHTPINQDIEIRRIFPKILNIISMQNNIKGSVKGSLSKYSIKFTDLMYNRTNWRDVNKDKQLTRQETNKIIEVEKQQEVFTNYQVKKAKEIIKKKYRFSELKDEFAKGEATHVHHIFPVNEFPQLSSYLENLIKLTASQHLQMAHPRGNTQIIDKNYQCSCLLAKSDSIEKSIKNYEIIYSLPNFIFVINKGLNSKLEPDISFLSLKKKIINIYNEN